MTVFPADAKTHRILLEDLLDYTLSTWLRRPFRLDDDGVSDVSSHLASLGSNSLLATPRLARSAPACRRLEQALCELPRQAVARRVRDPFALDVRPLLELSRQRIVEDVRGRDNVER